MYKKKSASPISVQIGEHVAFSFFCLPRVTQSADIERVSCMVYQQLCVLAEKNLASLFECFYEECSLLLHNLAKTERHR